MKPLIAVLVVLFLVATSFAQLPSYLQDGNREVHNTSVEKTQRTFPVRPYVAGGAYLFEEAGTAAVGGVIVDTPFLFSYSEAGYETGGKANDLVNTSHSGHTRYLRNQTLYRRGDWYLGAGTSWSKLYTAAYSKSNVHPFATVGREFRGGYVNKVLLSYVGKGTDWQNGVQGIEAQGWWTGRHVFLRLMVGGYVAHGTLTDRSNKPMTASQLATHNTTSQFQALIGWKF